MKPNFALNLSHDGISLLHRNEGSKLGWSLVGEVALDDPEMSSKLEMLRKTAAGLEQSGIASKLVIPASQILFTEVHAPAADDITREVQIREALDGLTPYEVGELVFDWRRAKGKMVRVAVVARETLQEAETFAKEHRFNPVSFVARGQNGFKGEAFFGMAAGASALLGAGVHVEPDNKPIPRIAALRPQPPEAEPGEDPEAAAKSAPEAEAPAEAPVEAPGATAPAEPAPGNRAEAAGAGDKPAEGEPPAEDAAEDRPEADKTPAPDTALPPAEEDEDARIAALLAEVPEPEPGDIDDLEPFDSALSPAEEDAKAQQAARPAPPPAPVLAPFPPSLDVEEGAKPVAKPATRPGATPRAKAAGKQSGKSAAKPTRTPPPPPPRREIPPLAKTPLAGAPAPESAGSTAAAGTKPATTATGTAPKAPQNARERALAAARSNGAAAKAPAKPAGPAPAFASRRRETPSGEIGKADLSAPGAVTPGAGAKAPPAPPPAARRNGAAPRSNGAQPPLAPSVTQPVLGGESPQATAQDSSTSGASARLSRAASAASRAARGLINRRKTAAKPQADRSADPATPPAKSRRLKIPGLGAGKAGKANGAAAPAPAAPALPGSDTTAIAPGPAARNRAPLAPSPSAKAPVASPTSEAERLTMFGARRSQTEAVGGKPKYLGLVLTLVLLLLMAVIALGSVFLFGEPDSTGSAPNGGSDFAAASVPEALLPSPVEGTGAALGTPGEPPRVPDATDGLASQPTPQSPSGAGIDTDPIAPPAAPATEPVETAQAPPAEPEPPRSPEVLSEDAAQTRYAATGIWEKAPEHPAEPQTSRIDDLYIASIDPDVAGHDAVALPPVGATANESRPLPPLPPAAPGTEFSLDDEGLVVPTPEGTLSPAGILVYSGKPEVVPPVRPGTVRPQILPRDELRQFRPKPRPTGLIEETQRANNSGNTLLELAAFRPNPRPEELAAQAVARAAADGAAVDDAVAGVIAEGELVNPTEEAVAASPQPGHRPGDFAAIVATARSTADASDGSTVVAASAAPTTTPSIPTRANVATQATIKNAIRLNQMNLIGIYGSSSSRRALVRLKSGRYVKVSVGERLNGGKVVSITENRLIYTKNGRNMTLELLPLG